jgi:uncharacterized OB-fold protein
MSTTYSTPLLSIEPPTPAVDLDSKFHWDGLREHKLLLQSCSDCERFRFPPMPSCPYCASRNSKVEEISGEGIIYSWIVVHRAFAEPFISQVPFTLATVEFKVGCRIVGRFSSSDPPKFGMLVRPCYFDHIDWTEIRFTV